MEAKRRPLCANCGCGATCHTGNEGCWGRKCLKGPDDARCQEYVPRESRSSTRERLPGPVAAEKTAQLLASRRDTLKRRVFVLFQQRRDVGYTDDELEVVLAKSHQSISACRNALMNEGLILDSGKKRENRYGSPSIVWTVNS